MPIGQILPGITNITTHYVLRELELVVALSHDADTQIPPNIFVPGSTIGKDNRFDDISHELAGQIDSILY